MEEVFNKLKELNKMSEISLFIDGQQVTVDKDKTVFEAAGEIGVYIPGLCAHPSLSPSGECGLCLAQIEGQLIELRLILPKKDAKPKKAKAS